MQPVLWAAGGTGFTCLMTALGASMVFFFRKRVSAGAQRIFLGFAAGVMVAAAVWSLLIPAIEEAESSGLPGWLPAAGGFLLGVLFLLAMDYLMPHLHLGAQKPEGRSSSWKRTTLLIFAVTLHNIPEGMAVGFSFALAAQHGNDPALYASAMALAIGMGIQNFPEGAAISLPLRQEGLPAWKSFLYGALSGVVEPDLRHFGRAGGGEPPAAAALAAGLCRRGHALRGGGGAHPRGPLGGALQRGHLGRDGRLFGDDGAGHRLGINKRASRSG